MGRRAGSRTGIEKGIYKTNFIKVMDNFFFCGAWIIYLFYYFFKYVVDVFLQIPPPHFTCTGTQMSNGPLSILGSFHHILNHFIAVCVNGHVHKKKT